MSIEWTIAGLLYVLVGLLLAFSIPGKDIKTVEQQHPHVPLGAMLVVFVALWLPGIVFVAYKRVRRARSRFEDSKKWRGGP